MDQMSTYIRDKIQRAGTMKSGNKEFVGINGNRDPDKCLHKMVEKIVRE